MGRRVFHARERMTVTPDRALDPLRTFPNASGRPMYLLDEPEPIRELI